MRAFFCLINWYYALGSPLERGEGCVSQTIPVAYLTHPINVSVVCSFVQPLSRGELSVF